MRMIEQVPLCEGILNGRLFVTEDSRKQSDRGLRYGESGKLPAGEHEVTEGNLVPGEGLADALVESLVATTEKEQSLFLRELTSQTLVEASSSRTQEDAVVDAVARLHLLDGVKDRFRA